MFGEEEAGLTREQVKGLVVGGPKRNWDERLEQTKEKLRRAIDNEKMADGPEEGRILRAERRKEELSFDLLWVRRISDEYRDRLAGKRWTGGVHKGWETEDAFMQKVPEIIEEAKTDRVFTRIAQSEIIGMYTLVVGGLLDDVYRKYIEDAGIAGIELDLSDSGVVELKTDLAVSFLERLREKNKEMELATKVTDPVTLGVEWEMAAVIVVWRHEWERMSRTMARGNDLTASQRTRFKVLDQMFSGEAGHMFRYRQPVLSEWMAAGLTKEGLTITDEVYEMVTQPATSPRTIFREMMAAMLVGGGMENGGIHATIGGVELSPEHTEIMEVTALLAAAGLLKLSKEKLEYHKSVYERGGRIKTGEQHVKFSETGLGEYYFPFHRSRDERMLPYPVRSQPGVEVRSLLRFKPNEFGTFVKSVSFLWLSGWMIQAEQKGVVGRARGDPEEKELSRNLVHSWREMMGEYRELLREAGIKHPKKAEGGMYVSMENKEYMDLREHKGETGYERFVTKLRYKAETDPEFRAKAYGIVMKYRKRVGGLIGY